MSWVRNLLISAGAYWFTLIPSWMFSLGIGKLNNLTYGDSIVDAIAMGVMDSMGRAICAAFGAVMVSLAATGTKPHRWAWVVAVLYVVASPTRYHWVRPPTTFDRVSQVADLLWPSLICLAVAWIVGRFKQGSQPLATGDTL